MNVGISNEGNNWKMVMLNFLVVFFAQFVFKLYDLLSTNEFPEPFECYQALITAAVATLAFYGVNKAIVKAVEEK